eukprot:12139862-Ditylum_brightwellii.AAC.1
MHDPLPEQMENNDDDSTHVPNGEGFEKDDYCISSIDSLNKVTICHSADDFEPLTEITDTTTTAIVDGDDIIVAAGENIPEDEIDGDTLTTGVTIQEEDENDDSAFTAGVIVQDDKETSSSEEEEVSEEEPQKQQECNRKEKRV